ncbi:Rhomboid family intramembrane serine protease [Sulfidibacter corallicola]|uniref:Rhomboid family intramembrane serine protease n=1 Tax=Sulfidibacter corallicola TaxID=2818388 RepID=A0A8A4TV58_SULCO|nr:rhomboid family intramembrane serine protease [Sulfidibacter corallicola]QTD52902.1 rhomboid family intramembrane serine protease [Sulfidibacter corallicola]
MRSHHECGSRRFLIRGPKLSPAARREPVDFQLRLLGLLLLIFVMWSVKVVETIGGFSLAQWGLKPRDPIGLAGLITMPFLHGDFSHLGTNTFTLLVLGILLSVYYPRLVWPVICWSAVGCSALVWLFARPSYHIGASGLVYGLLGFLFISGILRGDKRAVAAALVTAFMFGSAIWGILPIRVGVSWEGHLFGAIVGGALAYRYRHIDVPTKDVKETGEDPGDDWLWRDPF